MMEEINQYTSAEQLAYAGWLDRGMKIGFVVLVASFLVYLLGWAAPHVPVDQLPELWKLPAAQYLKAADVHTGWAWLQLAGKGDYMNFVGIAFLSAVTIFCYLRILPIVLAEGDKVYTAIVVLEVAVLVLAASGVLVAGH
jgi:hypothetical protein